MFHQSLPNIQASIMPSKHKQVYCKVCLRTMRKDVLKRHQKVHDNLQENEHSSTRSNVHRSQESIESASTFCSGERVESSTLSKIDEEGLKKMLRKKNQEYKEKIQLGQAIYKILGQDDILQESLDKIHKEALDLYIKQKHGMFKKT